MTSLLTNQVNVLIILLSLLIFYTAPFLLLITFVLRDYYDYLFIYLQLIIRIRDINYWNTIIFLSFSSISIIFLLSIDFYVIPILRTISFLLFNILIYTESWTNILYRRSFQLLNFTSYILHLLILFRLRSVFKSIKAVFFKRRTFLTTLHLSYFFPYFFTNIETLEWEQYFSVITLSVFSSFILSSLLIIILHKICKI